MSDMTLKRSSLFIVIGLVLIASACAKSPGSGGGGNIPDNNDPGGRLAKNQAEADFLDGIFDFTMEAYLTEFDVSSLAGSAGADLYPAIMRSTWGGEFTIDPDGNLVGQGKLVTEATMFYVDEDWCGYAFTELAEHTFLIGGKLKKEGEKYYIPIKIWSVELLTKDPPLGPAEPTCADPDSRYSNPKEVELFIPFHRNAMINFVLLPLHQTIGDQIEMGMELKTEENKVEYKIFISPEAIDLVE
jgi:hypothetical protein